MSKEHLVPKISENVIFHKFSKNSYFIHQTVYDHRVKISIEFYELLKKIDGKKSLGELAVELQDQSFDVEILHKIIYERLSPYGIIENDKIEVKEKKKPSYLKLSFIVIPTRTIAKVTPFLKFLFVPRTIKLVIPLCLMVITFGIISNFDGIIHLSLESIWPQLLIFGFVSVTFHEFGHATAAHYYGAEHGGIGGGFYLFSPVYFADVTDIWKLEPKKRIVVNLAGIYFEIIVCCTYIIMGTIFELGFFPVIGLFIIFYTLFNLNPFLRSDGYWILTDILEIPNLYKDSSQTLSRLIKSVFKQTKIKLTKREFFLALYASVNYVFIGLFIYYIAVVNPVSVLYLPINLYYFIIDIHNGTQQLTLTNLTEFAIPVLFYYLLFKLLRNQIIRMARKRKS